MNKPSFFRVTQLWEIIDTILQMKNCKVTGVNYIPVNNEIYLGPDHRLHLLFQSVFNRDLNNDFSGALPELKLLKNDITFVVPQGYSAFDCNLIVCPNKTQELKIKINRLDSGNIEDKSKSYWRYVYPINSEGWLLRISSQPYINDRGEHVMGSYLKPILVNSEMHVFVSKQKDEHLMVIQSGDLIDSDEMHKRVISITTALGLITGYKYGDYRFKMRSDDVNFNSIKSISFETLDNTKRCNYRIINNRWVDTYSLLGRFKYQKYAQKMLATSINDPNLYYDDDPMEAKAFNGLVNLCYNNSNMLISASMLLEGSVLDIVYQPLFYHVALEAITSAIMSNNCNNTQPPMSFDYFRKRVAPVLLAALNEIDDLPTDAKRVYENRINNNLNSQTNQDKLGASFNKYGYELTKEDLKAIKNRNATLHGNLINVNKELNDQQWDLFALALRLHKLCCILLLKAGGYTGLILNNEVLYGVEDACRREELPFINI